MLAFYSRNHHKTYKMDLSPIQAMHVYDYDTISKTYVISHFDLIFPLKKKKISFVSFGKATGNQTKCRAKAITHHTCCFLIAVC